MATRLAGVCGVLAIVIGLSGSWGQEATTAPAEAKLTITELVARVRQQVNLLPKKIDSSPTAEQETKAIAACKLFASAQDRLEELDRPAKALVGHLGIRAGVCAGEPKVMLAGAKLLAEFKEDKHAIYSACAQVWAGMFAGDVATARQGFDSLSSSSDKTWNSWAKRYSPIAEQAGKPIALKFALMNRAKVNLARTRGKVVVLHFWASWCGPCMRELPHIKTFYEERKDDKNFTLVSFSLDSGQAAAKTVIRDQGMGWPQAMDNGVRSKFRGRGIPHATVISSTGLIIWQGHPGNRNTFRWATDFARRQAARIAERKAASAAGKDPKPNPGSTAGKTSTTRPTAAKTPTKAASAADSRYRLAEAYLKAGMKAKAKAVLDEIIAKYPDTPAAAQAAKLLKSMS